MSKLREFCEYAKTLPGSPKSSFPQGQRAGKPPATPPAQTPPAAPPAPAPKDQTDDAGLRFDPNELRLTKKSGSDVGAMPEPGVEYDAWVNVVNYGQLPTGPFSVQFELSGGDTWKKEFKQDKGLKANKGGSPPSVRAVVNFKFPKEADYDLVAYLYWGSDPGTPRQRAGSNHYIVKKSLFPSDGDKSQAAQDQDVGAPAGDGGDAFSPDDFYAQTLQSSGYTVGSDPCLDKCWDEFYRCLKNGKDSGMQCLARLEACKRRCVAAGGDAGS